MAPRQSLEVGEFFEGHCFGEELSGLYVDKKWDAKINCVSSYLIIIVEFFFKIWVENVNDQIHFFGF